MSFHLRKREEMNWSWKKKLLSKGEKELNSLIIKTQWILPKKKIKKEN